MLLLIGLSGMSQRKSYVDEVWIIGGKKTLRSPFKKLRFDFQLDGRASFINNELVSIGGVKIGLEYRRVNRFGVGFYGLNNNIDIQSFEDLNQSYNNVFADFSYVTMYYERVVFFNPKWEFSATAHLGSGTVSITYQADESDDIQLYADYRMNPVEGSFSGFYHLNYWISVGGGYGYRWVFSEVDTLEDEYSSDLYILKAKIRLGKLVRSVFNKDVKNEY